ncbi:hypothetical protein PSEUDO9AG_40610 [Pseudomonas sp. 9Ag]|nr:hypothetical protein PSEUDO9AG_40610 [Pseudomonas sp. 9Ag]
MGLLGTTRHFPGPSGFREAAEAPLVGFRRTLLVGSILFLWPIEQGWANEVSSAAEGQCIVPVFAAEVAFFFGDKGGGEQYSSPAASDLLLCVNGAISSFARTL